MLYKNYIILKSFKSITKFRMKYYKHIYNSVYKVKTSFGSFHWNLGSPLYLISYCYLTNNIQPEKNREGIQASLFKFKALSTYYKSC